MATKENTTATDAASRETGFEERPHHSHSGTFVVIVATAITIFVALLAFTIFGHSSGQKLTHQVERTTQKDSDNSQ